MKQLPAGMQDHLDTGATTLCWCWHIKPVTGPDLGFTDHDRDLSFNGVTFAAASGMSASDLDNASDFSVANLEVTGALQSDMLSEAALLSGDYDDAGVDVWRVNWMAPDQRILMLSGTLGKVTNSTTGFSAEIRGPAHRLANRLGRVYQFGCDAVLGDSRCGVDLQTASYRAAATVSVAQEDRVLTVTGLDGFPAGWFDFGYLTWTSGSNAGRSMDIKTHRTAAGNTVVELWQPAAASVGVGDGFTAHAGCDKHFATCRAKFNNADNYRGFPHMPGNDYLASYPNRDDTGNDGSSRSA